jgi:CheY-like chemotaxis protein
VTTILVVDDEPDIRSVVGQVLREAGYRVLAAANGAEALERMHEQPPDGVVLDLSMPLMDGKSFLAACRADPAYTHVPVALFTTATNVGGIAETLDVQAYLSKPFDLDELTEAVARLVGQAPAVTPEPEARPRVAAIDWPLHSTDGLRWVAATTWARAAALRRQTDATRQTIGRQRQTLVTTVDCLERAAVHLRQSQGHTQRPASSAAGPRG